MTTWESTSPVQMKCVSHMTCYLTIMTTWESTSPVQMKCVSHMTCYLTIMTTWESTSHVLQEIYSTDGISTNNHLHEILTHIACTFNAIIDCMKFHFLHCVLAMWLTGFLMQLHSRHYIPDTAMDALIKFLYMFLAVLSRISASVEGIRNHFPSSLSKLKVKTDHFTRYVVCPRCSELYLFYDSIDKIGTESISVRKLGFLNTHISLNVVHAVLHFLNKYPQLRVESLSTPSCPTATNP